METRFHISRLRVYRTLPSLICFSGQRPSQGAKAEAFRKPERSGPTSNRITWAVTALITGCSSNRHRMCDSAPTAFENANVEAKSIGSGACDFPERRHSAERRYAAASLDL